MQKKENNREPKKINGIKQTKIYKRLHQRKSTISLLLVAKKVVI